MNPRSPDRFVSTVLFLTLLLLLGCFYAPVLFGHQTFVFVDASRFFYPLWKWGAAWLSQGLYPLWNQDAQFGFPYLADPQTAFAYPPIPILYRLLPPTDAFNALIILHHFWAILGTWVWGRSRGFDRVPSFLGALVFGFSLHVVCSSWTPVALLTISWIPWVFAAVERVWHGQSGGLLFLSFAWAMQFSAGYPVLVYLEVLFLVLYLSWKSFLGEGKQEFKELLLRSGVVLMSGLLALAYNLVWGLPFLEFFYNSNYVDGARKFQDLGWDQSATIFSPFYQGYPLSGGYAGPHYWVATYFVGLPALCLAFWTVVKGNLKNSAWVLGLAVWVLSLGQNLGLGGWLRQRMPGYGLVIHSGFWISFFVFWIAALAMEGSETVESCDRTSWKLWTVLAIFIYGAAWFLGGCADGVAFVLSLLALVLVLAVPGAWARWTFLALALALSLGPYDWSLRAFLDRSYYDQAPPIVSALAKPGRVFFSPPLMGEAMRLKGDTLAEAYGTAKARLYPNWPLGYGLEAAPIYNTLQFSDPFAWTFQALNYSAAHTRRALDYTDVRYILGKCDLPGLKKVVVPGDPVPVHENPHPLPKWFSVQKALPAGGKIEDDFSKADRSSLDYSRACFIADASRVGRYQACKVSEVSRTTDHLVLVAQNRRPALLVSSESFDPGWKVAVNGRPATVERINHAFRGVVVPSGGGKVAWDYEPTPFRLGLFACLATWAVWTLLFMRRLF